MTELQAACRSVQQNLAQSSWSTTDQAKRAFLRQTHLAHRPLLPGGNRSGRSQASRVARRRVDRRYVRCRQTGPGRTRTREGAARPPRRGASSGKQFRYLGESLPWAPKTSLRVAPEVRFGSDLRWLDRLPAGCRHGLPDPGAGLRLGLQAQPDLGAGFSLRQDCRSASHCCEHFWGSFATVPRRTSLQGNDRHRRRTIERYYRRIAHRRTGTHCGYRIRADGDGTGRGAAQAGCWAFGTGFRLGLGRVWRLPGGCRLIAAAWFVACAFTDWSQPGDRRNTGTAGATWPRKQANPHLRPGQRTMKTAAGQAVSPGPLPGQRLPPGRMAGAIDRATAGLFSVRQKLGRDLAPRTRLWQWMSEERTSLLCSALLDQRQLVCSVRAADRRSRLCTGFHVAGAISNCWLGR